MRKLQINILRHLRHQIPLSRIEVETKYAAAREPRAWIRNQLHERQEPAIEIKQMGRAERIARNYVVQLRPLVLADTILDQYIIQGDRLARQKIQRAVAHRPLRERVPKVRQQVLAVRPHVVGGVVYLRGQKPLVRRRVRLVPRKQNPIRFVVVVVKHNPHEGVRPRAQKGRQLFLAIRQRIPHQQRLNGIVVP